MSETENGNPSISRVKISDAKEEETGNEKTPQFLALSEVCNLENCALPLKTFFLQKEAESPVNNDDSNKLTKNVCEYNLLEALQYNQFNLNQSNAETLTPVSTIRERFEPAVAPQFVNDENSALKTMETRDLGCEEDIGKCSNGSALLANPQMKSERRRRTSFTREQLNVLEQAFLKKKFMDRRKREYLSQMLNISETSIKIWFQNRRMKQKRQSNLPFPIATSNPPTATNSLQNHSSRLLLPAPPSVPTVVLPDSPFLYPNLLFNLLNKARFLGVTPMLCAEESSLLWLKYVSLLVPPASHFSCPTASYECNSPLPSSAFSTLATEEDDHEGNF